MCTDRNDGTFFCCMNCPAIGQVIFTKLSYVSICASYAFILPQHSMSEA